MDACISSQAPDDILAGRGNANGFYMFWLFSSFLIDTKF